MLKKGGMIICQILNRGYTYNTCVRGTARGKICLIFRHFFLVRLENDVSSVVYQFQFYQH